MVSIIVPVYNVEKFLPRCIESVQRQTMQDLEIILVDDGSTDSSGIICDRYALKDNRINVIHQKNGGQVSARNSGIAIAQGEYIGFVDSDDWIEEDMISILYESAIMNKADVVAEGMVEDAFGKISYCKNALENGVYSTEPELNYLHSNMISCDEYFKFGILPYLWNKLFRRELVVKHMPFVDKDIRIGEDAAAVYVMLRAASSVVVLDFCHYHYCLRESSIMGKRMEVGEELKSAKVLYSYLSNRLIGQEMNSPYVNSIKKYMVNILLTRMYGLFAQINNSLLFPFFNVKEGDSIIIFGAGALGKAVFRYATKNSNIRVKGWADRDYEKYQKLELPVSNIEELDVSSDIKIVVAVFSDKAFEQINKNLQALDIDEEQIQKMEIDSEQEQELLVVLNSV